jgi:uncharacterized protein YdeI (YjbR/CyaY-like superfamily)
MALADVPPDISQALAADEEAARAFARLAPSHAGQYLKWIDEAKKDKTRRRRIADMMARLTGPRTQRGNGEG